jgi:hypothetical protein
VSLANERDVHTELGFITGRIYTEDNGFVRTQTNGNDEIAIMLNSNYGW